MHTIDETRALRDLRSSSEKEAHLKNLTQIALQISQEKNPSSYLTEEQLDKIASLICLTQMSREYQMFSYASSCISQVIAEIDV